MEFEWDPDKDAANEVKHGVRFIEAATVFGDPLEVTVPDPRYSQVELRFISIGQSENGRLLVVSYTEREPNRIRIISARKASRHERRQYEHDES